MRILKTNDLSVTHPRHAGVKDSQQEKGPAGGQVMDRCEYPKTSVRVEMPKMEVNGKPHPLADDALALTDICGPRCLGAAGGEANEFWLDLGARRR